MGAAGGSVAGAGRVPVTPHQQRKQGGEDFETRWRHSEERAARMRSQYEGQQAWTGSPADVEDLVGPNRSGGMETYTRGNKQTGLNREEDWGGAGVPARPKPMNGNGDGLSGGAARQEPVSVGGYF
jgi:hypothetical protein